MHPVLLASVILFCISGVVILAFLFFARTRRYLCYLGLAFLGLAVSLLTAQHERWIPLLLALAAFIVAVIVGINDTRARLRRFRAQQQEREAAFGEYLEATTRRKPSSYND